MAQSVGEVALDIVMGKNNVSDVVDDAVKGATESANKGSANIRNAVNKIDAGITKAGKAVAAGVTAAAAGLGAIVETSRDFRTAMGKVDTAFTTSGFSAETGRKTFEDFAAVLGDTDQATEAVGQLAKLATSEQDLTKWTEVATGVFATFGDGLPIEGLVEASNETAKVAKVTGPLADALNWVTTDTDAWNQALSSNQAALSAFQAGVSEGMSAEDAFNEALLACNSEQERSQLITATLTSLYGDAARTYRDTNGAVMDANRAQVSLNESMAQVGAVAEPVMSTVKQGIADVIAEAMRLTSDVDFTKLASDIQSGFGFFIDNVLPVIMSGFSWIIDHSAGLTVAIIGVSTAFGALKAALAIQDAISKIQNMIKVVKSWEIATKAQAIAQAALNAVMAINPVVLIIAAIAALVAIFVVLWNKCEGFRNFWINLWNGIKSIVSTAVAAIKGFFSGVVEFVKGNWQSLLLLLVSPFVGGFKLLYDNCEGFRAFINGFLEGVKTVITTVMNAIKTVITTVWNGIKTAVTTVLNAIRTVITTVWNGIKTAVTTVLNAIKTVVSTVWNGIRTVITTVVNAIRSVVTSVFNGIKSVVTSVMNAIKSTISRVWNAIKSVVSSVVNGMKSTVSSVFNSMLSAIRNTTNRIKSTVQSGFQNAISYIKSLPSQALGWGRDIIDGIVRGIRGAIGNITSAVRDVANKIKSYLHFSVPDEGPLTDYESWMPDFIQGMAKGINENKYRLVDAVKGMASELTVKPEITSPALKNVGSSVPQSQQPQADKAAEEGKLYALLYQLIEKMDNSGNITIPVYLGNDLIDEQIIRANDRRALRSGGRA